VATAEVAKITAAQITEMSATQVSAAQITAAQITAAQITEVAGGIGTTFETGEQDPRQNRPSEGQRKQIDANHVFIIPPTQ